MKRFLSVFVISMFLASAALAADIKEEKKADTKADVKADAKAGAVKDEKRPSRPRVARRPRVNPKAT